MVPTKKHLQRLRDSTLIGCIVTFEHYCDTISNPYRSTFRSETAKLQLRELTPADVHLVFADMNFGSQLAETAATRAIWTAIQ